MSVAIITSLLHTMLFKASKDGDSSLVSNENFSEKIPSSGWAQLRHQQPKT